MKNFKIVPLSKSWAATVRESMKDEFGHTAIEQVAKGKGPCRVSLKPFKVGVDQRILVSHSPFEVDNVFNQPGPVFINKEEVEEYADVYQFPKEIKEDKENFPLTLIGYNERQEMNFTKLVGDEDVDLLIERIFLEKPKIKYLHARNAEAGCFILKIERV